jgi:hypothetical protein
MLANEISVEDLDSFAERAQLRRERLRERRLS